MTIDGSQDPSFTTHTEHIPYGQKNTKGEPSKPIRTILKANRFGLKEDLSYISAKSLYVNNNFLSINDFERKFRHTINFLNHQSLKNTISQNRTLTNGELIT